jgi:hypothetical protein
MFKTIRTIHLCTGLFSLAFVLLYGVSAVQMAHSGWFNMRPRISEQLFEITPGLNDARAAARELMDHYSLRGELREIRPSPSALKFRIVRPGAVYEVAYAPDTGRAQVKTSMAGIAGLINRIHHATGLWHGYALSNIWTAMAGILSIALFTLGATGLYLWFKNVRERRIGGIILGFGLVLTIALIASMRAG